MAYKDNFSADEWNGLLEAPMLAGFAVTAADPGGLVGAFQESAAIVGVLRDASGSTDTLAGEISAAYLTSEGRKAAAEGVRALARGKAPDAASMAAIDRVGEVFATIGRQAPDQAAPMRDFLLDIATRTAEAAKEGGFLGFGGEAVSEAERQALAALRGVLGGMS